MRESLTELRLHPGRFLAVLAAIAISLGFLTLSQVFVQTETDAFAIQQVRFATKADYIVGLKGESLQEDKLDATRTALGKVPGVSNVDVVHVSSTMMRTEKNRNLYSQILSVPSEQFLWYRLSEGHQPTNGSEIVLNKGHRDVAPLGSKVRVGYQKDAPEMTVVGFADEPTGLGEMGGSYVHRDWFTSQRSSTVPGVFVVQGTPAKGDLTKVMSDTMGGSTVTVDTGDELRAQSMEEMTGDADIMKYVIGAFAVIAVLVGVIIIANTFQILVAQRRRQVGLLRAIGASSGQVRGRFLAEALLLGLIGSLLGVGIGIGGAALVSALWTGSIVYGLSIPWLTVAGILVFGVLMTLVASMSPIRTALRVAPLEALHPQTTMERRKGGLVRGIVCALLIAAGAAAGYLSSTGPTDGGRPVILALAAGFLISLGVLFSAQLYVPVLLRGLGRILGFTPTGRLATYNAARNPKRAASTAVALMLSIGLIVTIQVGGATIKRTVTSELGARYPFDISLIAAWDDARTPVVPTDEQIDKLKALPNVAAVDSFRIGSTIAMPTDTSLHVTFRVVEYSPAMRTASGDTFPELKAGEMWVNQAQNEYLKLTDGQQLQLRASSNTASTSTTTVTVRVVPRVPNGVMAPDKFAELYGQGVANGFVTVKLVDRNKAVDTVVAIQEQVLGNSEIHMTGAAVERSMFEKALDTLMLVVTGLLAAAAVIALIGVANTLGLSVIERRRENAMLRALGLQSSGVRKLLLVEALVLSGVGAFVGILAGIGFGFLGGNAVLRAADMENTRFWVDPLQTLIVIAIAAVAAVLASILPGRAAAKATPIEALADVG